MASISKPGLVWWRTRSQAGFCSKIVTMHFLLLPPDSTLLLEKKFPYLLMCMCVCMHVCVVCMHMCVQAYVCLCRHVCVCMDVCMCICACMNICMCAAYVCACMCVCTCICVHKHAYAHEGQKRHQISWNWRWRWSWASSCGYWELNLGSRQSLRAPNLWPLSPVPQLLFFTEFQALH